jgi:hypothetical protein
LAESTNDKSLVDEVFGYQKKESGHGSTLICSSAQMIGADGYAVDGLSDIDWNNEFYSIFNNLPIRQHVRINDKGHAANGGKFDEEIVFKGVRFCFEIELLSEDCEHIKVFENQMLPLLYSKTFRLGSGTRNGFGEIRVISIKQKYYNLNEPDELKSYLNKTSSLRDYFDGSEVNAIPAVDASNWTKYTLTLMPRDFVLFGSGFADDEADMTPVREQIVRYDNDGRPSISEHSILVPATSVKGAIAHRTAFYYNKRKGVFAETQNKPESNFAVETLFGSNDAGMRGNVIFSDIYIGDQQDKLFNHVAIDRFTGGGIDGALYNEKATYLKGSSLTLKIYLCNSVTDPDVRDAFESALDDLCNGYLPLGGCTNRGHGIFTGSKEVENGTV